MTKQTKKKGFEWYRSLTKKQRKAYRQELFNRTKYYTSNVSNEFFMRYKLNQVCSAYLFICGSFALQESKKGQEYWSNVLIRLKKHP